jgi:hypothetical protein
MKMKRQHTRRQNVCHTGKGVLRRKFIAVNAYTMPERSQTNNLMINHKLSEQQAKPKKIRWKEIRKIGTEILKNEAKRTI